MIPRDRLGLFDPLDGSPFASLGGDDVGTEASQQLALEAARQGIVLLKVRSLSPCLSLSLSLSLFSVSLSLWLSL